MMPTQQGSIKLFRFAGIQVYLHWSWFIVALIEIQSRSKTYDSYVWNAWEYIALFAIVLMHEFGHSLACRSVGGQADQIVLWPLGGVAYVDPPQRPGAILWSIAAGPLVNFILLPILWFLTRLHWGDPNLQNLVLTIFYINIMLFCFNVLPFYPLDGGQILRSLLWFFMGPATSLMVASIIGLIGVSSALCLAFLNQSVASQFIAPFWMLVIGVFMLMNCWRGVVHARSMSRSAAAPPIMGPVCPRCGNTLPPAAVSGNNGVITCPYCGAQLEAR